MTVRSARSQRVDSVPKGELDDLSGMYAVYQPVVDMRSGSVVGYEGLMRFADGTPPLVALTIAEGEGRLRELELAALKRCVDGADALPADALLSINLSASTLLGSGESSRILTGCDGERRIMVEVTERHPIDDFSALRRALGGLPPDALLAIDDYGVAYANLAHVLELRPDAVKIPGRTVAALGRSAISREGVAAVAEMCRLYDATAVAEGVETNFQRDVLLSLGVSYAQGYLFGRPERAADPPASAAMDRAAVS